MITGVNMDRRFWIGASDTHMVMSDARSGENWKRWWAIKTGLANVTSSGFHTKYTEAGDVYEKPIARAFGENVTEDRTILLPDYSIRVNYDADTFNEPVHKIIECKTFKDANGRLDVRGQTYKHYYMQMQVEMFAWEQNFGERVDGEMRIYYLKDEDYESASRGIALPLEPDRLECRTVLYNPLWIEMFYLPKLMPLAESLKRLREELCL